MAGLGQDFLEVPFLKKGPDYYRGRARRAYYDPTGTGYQDMQALRMMAQGARGLGQTLGEDWPYKMATTTYAMPGAPMRMPTRYAFRGLGQPAPLEPPVANPLAGAIGLLVGLGFAFLASKT